MKQHRKWISVAAVALQWLVIVGACTLAGWGLWIGAQVVYEIAERMMK